MTQVDAIISAFQILGGERPIREIEDWVKRTYGYKWKDFGTRMADMVPKSHGGNNSSTIPDNQRVLARVNRGIYILIK